MRRKRGEEKCMGLGFVELEVFIEKLYGVVGFAV